MYEPRRVVFAFRPLAAALLTALPLALSACGSVDPADSQPVTELRNQPEGFKPTDDGATLQFNEPAKIVTTNFTSGVPVYWEVTVGPPKELTVREVAEHLGRDPQNFDEKRAEPIRKFRCFKVTFTPLGTGLGRSDAPTTVELPTLTPVDDFGTNANFVKTGAEQYCGLNPDEQVPAYTADIEKGRPYETAVVTWEGHRDPGIVGTGVRLNTLISPRNPAQPAQSVTWFEGN
ncbi:hypothetical protein [Corynebacterium mayonis]|uniref:hypothetical protein n=1 Tax=Corynebacterium mayonis TaxID=3062461 RepID=UPI00313FEC57